jgi:hypothetical protein
MWFRQHRESVLSRMWWHLPSPVPSRAAMLGLRLAACGATTSAEDRGIDYDDDQPRDDRCAACQGMFVRGEA